MPYRGMVNNKKELLDRLKSLNLLKPCLRLGLLSTLTQRNLDMYNSYLDRLSKGDRKEPIYYDLAIEHHISDTQVRSIIKSFK